MKVEAKFYSQLLKIQAVCQWILTISILLSVVGQHFLDEIERILLRHFQQLIIHFNTSLHSILRAACSRGLLQSDGCFVFDFFFLVDQVLSFLDNQSLVSVVLQILPHLRIIVSQLLFIPVKILIGPSIHKVIHDVIVLFLNFLCLIFQFLSGAQASLVVLLLKDLIARFHILQTRNLRRLLRGVRIDIDDSGISTRQLSILRRSKLTIQCGFRIHFPMFLRRRRLQPL